LGASSRDLRPGPLARAVFGVSAVASLAAFAAWLYLRFLVLPGDTSVPYHVFMVPVELFAAAFGMLCSGALVASRAGFVRWAGVIGFVCCVFTVAVDVSVFGGPDLGGLVTTPAVVLSALVVGVAVVPALALFEWARTRGASPPSDQQPPG
jgi:hypothetical protein